MGQRYSQLDERLTAFIRAQTVFFVGTADREGRVNVSPKGMDTLRILAANRVVWLNLTGSGNETAAHLAAHDRMTLMFCAFTGEPLILRLYGRAVAVHPRDPAWSQLASLFPALPGARQCIDMTIDLIQTSCGFGVPLLDFKAQRDTLLRWADKKGAAGLEHYWQEKNRISLDGKPTHILDDEGATVDPVKDFGPRR